MDRGAADGPRASPPSPDQHGVPKLRGLPAFERAAECRLRASRRAADGGGAAQAGGRSVGAGPYVAAGRPPAASAFGRTAAARPCRSAWSRRPFSASAAITSSRRKACPSRSWWPPRAGMRSKTPVRFGWSPSPARRCCFRTSRKPSPAYAAHRPSWRRSFCVRSIPSLRIATMSSI